MGHTPPAAGRMATCHAPHRRPIGTTAVRIAYQGEPGAYSEAASLKWSPDADAVACPAFDDVFDAVDQGTVACGTLPIENSIGGTIHRNYDLLLTHNLRIIGEVELPVSHALVALPGTTIDRLTQVYSHPQALAQCDGFLRTLRGIDVIATYDTAGSAKLIAERKLEGAAAIASERAAQLFGLTILKSAIQDFTDNITRFLIVARGVPADDAARLDADKTTIVFTLRNEAGALFKALSVFALRDIGLTKLESRPIPGKPWEYLFYADLSVGAHDARCGRALTHMAEFAMSLRTLGSYRQCEHPTPPGSETR